jgi:hypothetical protein
MENREPVKKSIVITSIYPPTEAVLAFSYMTDYNLIVVGDKKTPANWQCNGVEFLPVDAQNRVGTHLNKVLPFNHYCRKMLGYVKAIGDGAAYIVDTDDDNIPKEGWAFPEFEKHVSITLPATRVLSMFTNYIPMRLSGQEGYRWTLLLPGLIWKKILQHSRQK